jgi:hypothetical protein
MSESRVNSCWSSPAQSFFVPSPARLMTIFYYLTILPSWNNTCNIQNLLSIGSQFEVSHCQDSMPGSTRFIPDSAVKNEEWISRNCVFWQGLIVYFLSYDTGRIENDASNNSCIVSCVFLLRDHVYAAVA